MSDTYDVLVIGSGTAAQNVAPRCAQEGLRVAVVDRLPYGGTCAQRGCDPKKVLLAAAEAVSRARGLDGDGLVGRPRIDWPALMARKRTYTAPVPERIESWMRDAGAETLHGAARLRSPHEAEVDGRVLEARDVVLATGARPMDLGVPGAELVTTSTEFLELDELPPRICFIGGGYISFEFAWLAHAAGAEVTVLHRSAHVLKGFDPAARRRARRALPLPRHRRAHRGAGPRGAPARGRARRDQRRRRVRRRPRRPRRRPGRRPRRARPRGGRHRGGPARGARGRAPAQRGRRARVGGRRRRGQGPAAHTGGLQRGQGRGRRDPR